MRRFMQAMHFAFGFGAFIGPLVVGAFLRRFDDVKGAFIVMACMFVPVWSLNCLSCERINP